jgi:hypothetical protein
VTQIGKCSNWTNITDSRWNPLSSYPNVRIGVLSTSTASDTAWTDPGGNADLDSLQWWDIVNCTRQRSWHYTIHPDLIGSGEGNASFDGRWIAISTNHTPPKPDSVVIIDMASPGRVSSPYQIPACHLASCKLDYISISASGLFLDVKYDNTEEDHRIFAVDTTNLTLSIVSMPSGSNRCATSAIKDSTAGWIFPLKHPDMTLDPYDSNHDIIVGVNKCSPDSGRVAKVRLSDGVVTFVSKPGGGGFPTEGFPIHVSTRNQDRLGWAYVSYDTVTDSLTRYDSEVVAYKLDGSKAMQRLVHTHAFHDKNLSTILLTKEEIQPVPSRDGKRVMFASNWFRRVITQPDSFDVKAYVADATSFTNAIGNLSPGRWTKTTDSLQWTAPSDLQKTAVASYDLRYSTAAITSANFSSATSIGTGTPASPGTLEKKTVTGLTCDTQYYFAIKSTNVCGTVSDISNIICMYTLGCNGHSQQLCDGGRPQRTGGDDGTIVFGVRPIAPTPSTGQIILRFTLPRQDGGSIEVVDVAGRVLERHDLSGLGAGDHEQTLGESGRLRPGWYYIRITHGNAALKRAMVVLR